MPHDKNLEIGKRVRALRVQEKLTMLELCVLLQQRIDKAVTEQTIYKYESGINTIPLHTLCAYCDIFGISSDRILGLQINECICSTHRALYNYMQQNCNDDITDSMIRIMKLLEKTNRSDIEFLLLLYRALKGGKI